MKILVVSQYYYPENFRINDICEGLVRRGHDVTVLTGLPNYPRGKIYEGYENSFKRIETLNGVTVIRCKTRPRKNGVLNLLLSYISFAKKASSKIKRIDRNFDVVYAYQMSPVSLVLPAIKYKKLFGVPLYIYVCDVWPESMRDSGNGKIMSTKNPIFLFFKKLSKSIYRQADLIGVKCNEFADYLKNVCSIDTTKCVLNYEHAEDNYLKVNEVPLDNGIVDFMFLGNLGHSSNCDLILKAAKRINYEKFKIHFVGDGSELNNLIKLTKSLGLEEKVVFHGRVSQQDVIDFYNLCDVCLLTLSGKSFIGLTPPAKLTGYMAACRPIVASIDGAAARIIRESNSGYVCSSDDVEEFAKLLEKAILQKESLSQMGKNGRSFFKNEFTLQKHLDTLESHLFSMKDNFSR